MGLNPMLYDGLVRQHQQELISQATDARRTSALRPRPFSRLQRLASRFTWIRTVADTRVPGLRGEPTVQLQAGSVEITPVIDTNFDVRTDPGKRDPDSHGSPGYAAARPPDQTCLTRPA
jgi:hypothetical protein